jgi:hypothetical protein
MMPSSARVAALCVLAVVACSRAPRPGAPSPETPSVPEPRGEPRNGLEVVGWMRYTHPARSLHAVAFTVRSARGSDTTESRVYALLPGAMRIDVTDDGDGDARTSLVRDRQRASLFRGRQRVSTLRGVDLHQLLAFDVFAEGVDTTIMWLDSARVRFGIARTDRFAGRRAWVVGAPAGDDSSSQFWVDADRWRLLRVIQREPRSPERRVEVRYLDYTELLDTPLPTRIEVWRDGQLVEQQLLTDFVANPGLPRRAFDLGKLRAVPDVVRTPHR